MSITRLKANGDKFTLYAVCNSRGDVEELRKESGALYARYVYDSWGNVLHIYSGTGTTEITDTANLAIQNPFRYRGYYYDTESGLYYLQSRYYDPVTGRFVNADSLVDTSDVLGFNMYAYCGNNPVMYVDHTGYVANFVNSFSSTMKDAWIKGYDYVGEAVKIVEKGFLRTFFDAFTFEMGAGYGLGLSADIGFVGLEALFKGNPLHVVLSTEKGQSGLYYTFENSYSIDMIYYEGYYEYKEKTKFSNPSVYSCDEDTYWGPKKSFAIGASLYFLVGYEIKLTFDYSNVVTWLYLM